MQYYLFAYRGRDKTQSYSYGPCNKREAECRIEYYEKQRYTVKVFKLVPAEVELIPITVKKLSIVEESN